MTKNATKRALLTSALALVVCISMLIGTTYAWFTDSVTSANNIITSGNLDVELYYMNDETSDWTEVNANTNIFKENTLWEPGHTEVVKLKVVNAGTLALKYQLGVNIASEIKSVSVLGNELALSNYIKYAVIDDEQDYTRDTAVAAAEANNATALKSAWNSGTTALEAKNDGNTDEKIVTMVVYMPTTVGNEAYYRGNAIPTINLGINLFATQYTSEEDSFGSDYDEGAHHEKFKVTNANDLQNAANNAKPGDVIEIVNDLVLTEPVVIPAAQATFSMRSTPAPVVINLNGKTITADESTYAFNNLGNLILTDSVGSGSVKARGIYNGYGQGGENVSSAYLFVDNVTINALGSNGGAAIYNYGIVEIKNSEFTSIGGYALNNQAGGKMTLSNSKATGGIYNLGELTVYNSTVYQHISGRHAIYNWSGSVVINGGQYDSISGNELILADGEGASVVINGGTFDKTAKSWLFGAATGKNITFVINGGTFNGYVNLPENTVDTIRPYNDPIVVYGGTFNFNPTKWIATGYKAEQVDGAWVVSVAIKTAEDLQNAINNAKEGETIYLLQDITSVDGVLISNKNLTIDLGGHTFSVSEGASVSNRNIKIIGSSNVTVKNGTLIANGNTTSGSYGTIRTEGTANVTLENLKLYNYRGGGLNVKAVTGTTVTINNCEIYSQYGGGVEASGGTIVLNEAKIEQKGVYTNGWYSVAMEINSSGKITVNSGEYSGSAIATDSNAAMGNCVAFILSSGGTLNINGGTFNGTVAETANASNFCGLIYADKAAVVNINGGTFNSNGAILDMRNNAGSQPNPVATISGGTFSADPRVSGLYASNLITVADGYEVVVNDDGTYAVAEIQ